MELSELDRLIDARAEKNGEPERPVEAMWAASVRLHNAAKAAANREAWATYHREQARRLRRTLRDLVAHHETRAKELSNETNERTP